MTNDISDDLTNLRLKLDAATTAVERLGAENAELRKERDALAGELRSIDSLMARRPALDKPTRYENIAHAIHTAGRCDAAERKLHAQSAPVVAAQVAAPRWVVVVGKGSWAKCYGPFASFDTAVEWLRVEQWWSEECEVYPVTAAPARPSGAPTP
jgi:hypothetical protein